MDGVFLEGGANIVEENFFFGSKEAVKWRMKKQLLVIEDLYRHSQPTRLAAGTVHVYRSLGRFRVALNRMRGNSAYP